MKNPLSRLLLLLLLPVGAGAQGLIQNMEVIFMGGPIWYPSQTIPGSNATLQGSLGHSFQVSYAYQVMRSSRGKLWVEFWPMTFFSPGSVKASIPAAGANLGAYVATPGVRYMLPVQERISVYGILGGGYGDFQYAHVTGTANSPVVHTEYVYHGVFEMGGGVDYRITRFLSVRAEFRDFVTGRGLSGVPGRNHATPLLGIATHF